MPNNETYLGDGLYASMDGGMICLRAPRLNGDHSVFLEFDTLLAFARWMHEQKIVLPRFNDPDASGWNALVQAKERAEADLVKYRAALAPFVDFARGRGFDCLPDDVDVTAGSRMARRQLTTGDFRKLLAAIGEP